MPPDLRPGNVVTGHDLEAAGLTRAGLRRSLDAGELTRLRIGWYALPGADPTVSAAVRAHGVLSCVSALTRLGVWRPVDDGWIHVRARRGRVSGHDLRGCSSHLREPAPCHAVDDLRTSLSCMVWCLPADDAITCLDSVMNLGLATMDELRWTLPRSWAKAQTLLDRCDRAESGSESLVRLRLRRRNLRVRVQVRIEGVGRVDLLVGDRLVIEVDSRTHHTAAAQYHSDRFRDQRLVELGYRVIRVTWEQVMFDWEPAEHAIMAAVHRGDHLWHGRHR